MVMADGPVEATGYIHSACHQARWELAVDDNGKMSLVCAQCHQDIGPQVEVRFGASPSLAAAPKGMLDMYHSPCCNGHWKLLTSTMGLFVACEKCDHIHVEILVRATEELPPCMCCGGDMDQ